MEPAKRPTAGGAILAGSILLGVAVGILAGEPSIGFLAGLALGAAVALTIWLRDRRS
jgi:hypothetical protein